MADNGSLGCADVWNASKLAPISLALLASDRTMDG